MYATIVTAALFSGIIFNDLIQAAEKTTILKHFLFGLIASTAMAFLTLRGADLAAWGLLLIPVLAVLISSIIAAVKAPTAAPAAAPLFMPPPPPKMPEPEPTINTPIDTPYMKTICYEVDQPPCPAKDTSKAQCTLLDNGDIAPPTGTCPESKPEPVKPEPAKPKCVPKTEEPPTPAQAADLLKAVTSKLTPSVTCPSG